MSKYLLIFYSLFCCAFSSTQPISITLNSCLKLARENYPLIRQLELITSSEEYSVSNISKSWLPQINLNAQASYQSEVTHFDLKIPGLNLPDPPNKDQYKINLEIGQVLYDGGQISAQKNISKAASKIEIIKTELELFKIQERIQQLFFGNLLIQKQISNIDLLQKDIEEQIKKAKAAYDVKAIAATVLYSLQAEQIKVHQRKEELKVSKSQWLLILSKFIGQKLDANTQFIMPETPTLNILINRQEIQLFDQQMSLTENQSKLQRSYSKPRMQAFVQLGYANPALNFLKNEFQSYYVTGLKFSWNLSTFYTIRNINRLNVLNKSITELQKESFEFNTQLNIIQQEEEIRKYQNLLASDKELISLRVKIKEAAKAQWENGVITVSDYLRELNAEEQARTNETLHQIQYLQSSYLHNYYSGN